MEDTLEVYKQSYDEVTDQRTAVDWAHQTSNLVDVHYPHASRIKLVMDNLNTHTGASLI